MAQLNKIKSFKSFSEVMAQDKAVKIAEENATKRGELAAKIAALIDEMNITSFDDLDEEVKREFITKAFGNVSEEEAGIEAEELEDETSDVTEPIVDADGEEVDGEVEDVEKDLELDGEGDAEGEEIAEGNAFIYAAAKAKAAGKKEFEFNGKKYKVTLNTDTGLKESVLIITEGTRGQFGKIYKSGEIASVYTHYDSYPEHMLPVIKKGYKKGTDVDAVLGKGDNSGLEVSPEKMNFYGDPNSLNPMKGSVKNLKKYINDADANGAEYAYLYDERDKKWYMIDLYGDRELVPAFESNSITEKYNKKSLMKAMKKDDGLILVNGNEYIIYKYGNGNNDNDAMWNDDSIFALDQDGEEHEIKYADIERYSESVVTEGEVDIHDEIGYLIEDLYAKLNDLAEDTTDSKWRKAIESIVKGIEGVESKIGQAANKLGIVPTHESVESAVTEAIEINEAEIKSDEEFKEYAVSVLQKAFGEDYDEAKAMEVVDGILGKVDGDYGAAVGMLTSSLGESVEVNESCGECGQNPCECDSVEEKKADGTISDDEDEKREELLGEVEQVMDTLLKRIKEVSFEIGGNFRAPGIQYDAKKVIDNMVKKFK